ncbi:MAG TPA: VTT domain-containing protein [Candidatus Paceibacterota bacterium]
MGILTQAILPFILLYKYWALFTLTFLASLAIPIPAGTILIASAAFASQGYFNIITIFIIVLIANIAGDNVSYWLARQYGKKIFSYIKFTKKILESTNFTLIEKAISSHPGFIVFISRFEVLSTLSINIICGLGKVTYKKFMIFEVMGSFVNVIFFILIGYFFGNSWQAVNKLIGNFSIFFFLFIFLILSIFWKKIIKNLKKEKNKL